MNTPRRIYGFRVVEHPDGWRRADCPRWIRFAFHIVARAGFRALPPTWISSGGWRGRISDAVLPFYGYWAYSHEDECPLMKL
jgi:hypothetical protein